MSVLWPFPYGSFSLAQRRTTWFLRKAAASFLEHRLVCRIVRFVVASWFATPRTPSLFVQAANLWYDIRDIYIVRFVADGVS